MQLDNNRFLSLTDYILQTAQFGGSIEIFGGGDSMWGGVNYNGGVRNVIAAGLLAKGIYPNFVGGDAGNSNERILNEVLYAPLNHHGKGGKTAGQYWDSNADMTPLKTFQYEMDTEKSTFRDPDLVILDLGTNGVTAGDVANICGAVKKLRGGNVPLVWITPVDSSGQTVESTPYDSSRRAYIDIIVAGMKTAGVWGKIVNSQAALGLLTRFPMDTSWQLPASTTTGAGGSATFTYDPGWYTGFAVTLSANSGTALTAGTTYYVIRNSSGNYSFATSRANALAGTKITLDANVQPAFVYGVGPISTNTLPSAVFADSTHLSEEGNFYKGCGVLAALLGGSVMEWARLLATSALYGSIPFGTGGSVSNGGTLTIPGQILGRKKALTSITVNNPDASNIATVTLQKLRRSGNRSTISLTSTGPSWTIPAGGTVTRGKSWSSGVIASECGGPVAWLNEEFVIAISTSGSACNVEVEGINVIA